MGLGMPQTPGSHQDPGGGMAGWGFQPRSLVTPEKGPDWVRSQPAAWPCTAGPCREPVPSSGVVCPAAWSGGPCRHRGSEHPHCGPGTPPRPPPRPSRLGAVDMRQRPCPVTSVSSPPQVPRPHTRRPSWPHRLGMNGLWLQPVTLAGPVAAGGAEGVPRACLSTSAVRGETGVQ